MGEQVKLDRVSDLTEVSGSQSKFNGPSPDMVPRPSELRLGMEMGTQPGRVNAMFGVGTHGQGVQKIGSQGMYSPNGSFLQFAASLEYSVGFENDPC